MIKIDPNKKKTLSFSVNVEGIDPQLLEYNLRLSSGNIDYGFKGVNNNGEISFSLPPLKEVVNSSNIENINNIKLEVHDKNNKYYLKPFEDNVKIDKQLKIEATLSEEKYISEENEFKVNASIKEDTDKEEEKSQQPKSKFGNFLKG